MLEGTGTVDNTVNLHAVRTPKADNDLRRIRFGRIHRETGHRSYLIIEGSLP